MLHSIILNLIEDNTIMMCLINIYHLPPMTRQHSLSYVFRHPLDDLTPTLLISNLNTHSP